MALNTANNGQWEILSRPRHLRLLYFIEKDYDSTKLLNLFKKNQKMWGGRVNPIIPMEPAYIDEKWEKCIEHYDPDYVYYTSKLDLEYIKILCYKLGFNPVEILNIDEPTTMIPYVGSEQLFDLFKGYKYFVAFDGMKESNSLLKPYFELNYHILDLWSTAWPEEKYERLQADPEQSEQIHGYILSHLNWFFNKNLLALANLDTPVLREVSLAPQYFELIIAKDYGCLDDLMYFWNRSLFVRDNSFVSHYIITSEQWALLAEDSKFCHLINYINTPDENINIVSFSLKSKELLPIKQKLQSIAVNRRFNIKDPFDFPFNVLDTSVFYNPTQEESHINLIQSPNHLLAFPALSFGKSLNRSPQKWALDVKITKAETRKALLHPFTFNSHFICNNEGRINRRHELTVCIHSQHNTSRVLKISIPSFPSVASHIITYPRFTNDREKQVYFEITLNDSSSRLKEFLRLFDNDFHYMGKFIYDKFWMDFFEELSANARVEGDCFTLQILFDRCVSILNEISKPLDEATYRNAKSLKQGLTSILQELCKRKIVLPGFIIKCRHCSSKIWYSVTSIRETVICNGCSNSNLFQAEIPISYKLNHLIKNNIAMRDENGKVVPDGNMAVIRTLNYLSQKAHQGFEFSPQVNLYEHPHDELPQTDLDILCLVDGKLFIGECKHDSFLFKGNKSLDNLLDVASKIRPDTLVLGCMKDSSNRLEKSKKYLESKIRKWNYKPHILVYHAQEADYFELNGDTYFS